MKGLAALLLLLAASGCGSGVADPFPAAINDATVFLGDSITYFWPMPVHNAGIPGQGTGQIQARFQTDVVQTGLPQVVVLTGANDIRNPAPDYASILVNIDKMVSQGRAAGISVILCELTPITCCETQVQTLNAMIRTYAAAQRLTLVDYYTPMAGHDATYLGDGLHPSPIGYAVMEDTLTQTLQAVN